VKRSQLDFTFVLVSLILLLVISCQQQSSEIVTADQISGFLTSKSSAKLPVEIIQPKEAEDILPKLVPTREELLPRISFEKTVCDLGEVGQDSKNTCGFKFTNTGQDLLKIGNIKRTCGCTVFELLSIWLG